MAKTFLLDAEEFTDVYAYVDLDNDNNPYGRLFVNGELVFNGVTGISKNGCTINIPGDELRPGRYNLLVQLSPDQQNFHNAATGSLAVHVRKESPNTGAGNNGNVMVTNFPSEYPIANSQYNNILTELQTIANKNYDGNSDIEFPDTYPLPAEQVDALRQVVATFAAGQAVGLDAATLSALENVVVSGTVALNQATLDALESVTAVVSGTVNIGNFPATQQVSLDATSLAALENITVAIANGQIVGLDSTTINALKSVVVSGQVSLDTATINALKTITATVSGTVGLDPTTVNALKNVNATIANSITIANFPATQQVAGTVNVGNFPSTQPVTGPFLTDAQLRAAAIGVSQNPLALSNDSVRQTLRASLPYSQSMLGPQSNYVMITPPAGQRIRLIRNAGHVDPTAPVDVFPLITIKLGNTTIYNDRLEAGLPWSETVCFEGGVGETLRLYNDSAVTIYFNMRYEIF